MAIHGIIPESEVQGPRAGSVGIPESEVQGPRASCGGIPESEVQEPRAGCGGIPESEVQGPKAGSGSIPESEVQGSKKNAYAPRLRTYTQPTQLLAAGAQLAAHTQPILRTGITAPAWHQIEVKSFSPGYMEQAPRLT